MHCEFSGSSVFVTNTKHSRFISRETIKRLVDCYSNYSPGNNSQSATSMCSQIVYILRETATAALVMHQFAATAILRRFSTFARAFGESGSCVCVLAHDSPSAGPLNAEVHRIMQKSDKNVPFEELLLSELRAECGAACAAGEGMGFRENLTLCTCIRERVSVCALSSRGTCKHVSGRCRSKRQQHPLRAQ